MQVLEGSTLATSIQDRIATRVREHLHQGRRAPCLAVLLVGDNPASKIYVARKTKIASLVGIQSQVHTFDANVSQIKLRGLLKSFSEAPTIDGILLQLPLPAGLSADELIACIDPTKDVDGLTPLNQGLSCEGSSKAMLPCTPLGIMDLLTHYGFDPKGKSAVVIGRSRLVGAPIARLLTSADATVSILHSKTPEPWTYTRGADLIVAAAGVPRLITRKWIDRKCFVVDVGIHRQADNSLVGDVDRQALEGMLEAITPVPGGIGPMTIASLMANCLKAYEARLAEIAT